jgi:hypothetical protein
MKYPPLTGAVVIFLLFQLRRLMQKRDKYFNMTDDEIETLSKGGDRKARQELDDRTLQFKNENL